MKALAIVIALLIVGDTVTSAYGLPVPGPAIGLIAVAMYFTWRGGTPEPGLCPRVPDEMCIGIVGTTKATNNQVARSERRMTGSVTCCACCAAPPQVGFPPFYQGPVKFLLIAETLSDR